MKLSIFTDEISPEPARAITLAAEWQVPYVELRGLTGGRFPRVSDDELHTFHQLVIDAAYRSPASRRAYANARSTTPPSNPISPSSYRAPASGPCV